MFTAASLQLRHEPVGRAMGTKRHQKEEDQEDQEDDEDGEPDVVRRKKPKPQVAGSPRVLPCRGCMRKFILQGETCLNQDGEGSRCFHCAKNNHSCFPLPSSALAVSNQLIEALDKVAEIAEGEDLALLERNASEAGKETLRALREASKPPGGRTPEFAQEWAAHRAAESELRGRLRRFGAAPASVTPSAAAQTPDNGDELAALRSLLEGLIESVASLRRKVDSMDRKVDRLDRKMNRILEGGLRVEWGFKGGDASE